MTTTPALTGRDIGQAAKATGALLDRLLAEAGISFPEWTVLFTLDSAGPLSRGELVQRQVHGLKIPVAEAQATVDGMRSSGLLTPAGDGDDPALEPTEAGEAVFRPVRQAVSRLTEELYGDLPPTTSRPPTAPWRRSPAAPTPISPPLPDRPHAARALLAARAALCRAGGRGLPRGSRSATPVQALCRAGRTLPRGWRWFAARVQALCRARSALPRGLPPKAPDWVLPRSLARQGATRKAKGGHPRGKPPPPTRQSATHAANHVHLRGKGPTRDLVIPESAGLRGRNTDRAARRYWERGAPRTATVLSAPPLTFHLASTRS
jgi:DNA-binding MarR family transcriptional regulator